MTDIFTRNRERIGPRPRSSQWTGKPCWRCGHPATVADHVVPVTPSMPDSLFFDRRSLRPACRPCNLIKGIDESGVRSRLVSSGVVRGDYTRR
jgi:5-methylcytosine-specific restriction endonuclease McrA